MKVMGTLTVQMYTLVTLALHSNQCVTNQILGAVYVENKND